MFYLLSYLNELFGRIVIKFLKFICSIKIDIFFGIEIFKWLVVYFKGVREYDYKLKVGILFIRFMLSDRMNFCFILYVFYIFI